MHALIDTHVLLWMAIRRDLISPKAKAVIEDSENILYVSAISDWEIAQKWSQGKLPLPKEPSEYMPVVKETFAIQPLSFEPSSCKFLEKLPPYHRDPFDRMLICQALEYDLTIVTSDILIQQYPIKTLW